MGHVPPFVRGLYNYDTREASDSAVVKRDYGESLTVQAHMADADLNLMMHRMGITGRMPENVRLPQYGDFTQVSDFRSALESVRHAQEAFMELPAAVRARFDNDPQLLLEFVSVDENRAEAQKLGLLKEVSNGGITANASVPNQASGGGAGQVASAAGGSGEGGGQSQAK